MRYVGDPVAFVVAETLLQAKDAAEAVELDIEPLPAVTDPEAAAQPGAPLLYDEAPGNVALDYHYGDSDKVAAAFASAAHVTQAQAASTTAWSSTRWSRAPRSREYDPQAAASRSTPARQGVFGMQQQHRRACSASSPSRCAS